MARKPKPGLPNCQAMAPNHCSNAGTLGIHPGMKIIARNN